jgi:pyridoxal phosphate enzyme (YggS family)
LTIADGGVRVRLDAARRRIAAAAARAGRDPQSVRTIAVTKTVDVGRIAEAVDAGVVDVGENRVQEALGKRAQLPASLRWHLIGHLQTNKAAKAASAFVMVHSVDSARVAEALAARRPPELGDLDICLEVELTGIPGRTGFNPDALAEGFEAVSAVAGLRVAGLMTMAALVDDVEQARPTFARLRRLRDDLEQRSGRWLPELSMGMSNDFEVAVEEGSTMVRLGRVIFGERPPRTG